MTLEEKLKEKIVLFTDRVGGSIVTGEAIAYEDALSICKSEIDEERNIGARLMAERILNELKNPSDGKFGCDTANAVIDYFKSEIAEACKDMEIISASTFEVVDIDDQIEQAEIRGYNNALRNLRKRFSPSPKEKL